MSSVLFSLSPPFDLSHKDHIIETINKAWDLKDQLSSHDCAAITPLMDFILDQLDKGRLKVCEKKNGVWQTHQWLKKAILLSFRLTPSALFTQGPKTADEGKWFDKVPLKCQGWTEENFEQAGFRLVPGAVVRRSAYIAPQAVIMPSFINVGAFVGTGTMIDTWATIGSCAHIGSHCHISGGVGIGGVLEPLQANPVIIEDNCFIGARCEVAEGVLVEEGAVLSMGVFLGASTKIFNRATGEITLGRIPPYSVVVPGTLPATDKNMPPLACAVIVKQVDTRTRAKTSINDLLRD